MNNQRLSVSAYGNENAARVAHEPAGEPRAGCRARFDVFTICVGEQGDGKREKVAELVDGRVTNWRAGVRGVERMEY
jgi:hypothetical protein